MTECCRSEKLCLRLQARFMTSAMLTRRISGLGTPTTGGRMDGEKKPWPMWE